MSYHYLQCHSLDLLLLNVRFFLIFLPLLWPFTCCLLGRPLTSVVVVSQMPSMDAVKYSLEADKYRSPYPTLPSSSLAMSAMYNAVTGCNPSSGTPTSGSDSATTTTPTPPSSTTTTNSTPKYPENLSSSSPPPKPNYLDPLGRNYLDTKAYFDSSKLYLQEHAKYADPSRYEFMSKYPTEGSTGSRSPTTPEIKAEDSPSSVSPPSAGLLSYYHHHQSALPPGLIPMSQYAAAVAGHHYHLHAAAAAAAASASGSGNVPSGPSSSQAAASVANTVTNSPGGSTSAGAEFRRPLTVIF